LTESSSKWELPKDKRGRNTVNYNVSGDVLGLSTDGHDALVSMRPLVNSLKLLNDFTKALLMALSKFTKAT
jgi:hypothetical protein